MILEPACADFKAAAENEPHQIHEKILVDIGNADLAAVIRRKYVRMFAAVVRPLRNSGRNGTQKSVCRALSVKLLVLPDHVCRITPELTQFFGQLRIDFLCI